MLRILPFLIIFLLLFVSSKLMDAYKNIPNIFSIAELKAEDDKKQENSSKEENKNTDTAEPKSKEENSTVTNKEGKNLKNLNEKNPEKLVEPPIQQFSVTEIEILESLSKRREELNKREEEISLKENILKVTEKRIQQKIDNIQSLMIEAKGILDQYNEKQKQETSALVKIYENMKPKDAARIFDELEMPILVEVSSRMKEAKLAAVLGLMSSERAKDLTIELANRRKIDLSNYN